jgi:hypothetical protein
MPHHGGGKAPQLEVHNLSPYILAHCVVHFVVACFCTSID